MSDKKRRIKFNRSKKGVASVIYNGQRTSSKRRGHRQPEYNQIELEEWLYSQTLFHELYSEWVLSGYEKYLKPSVDRKFDDVHYCMSNIQLMTWGENNTKAYKDRRGLKFKTRKDNGKVVLQYLPDGTLWGEHITLTSASLTTLVNLGNIGECCNGNRKTAGGFIWKYKKDISSKR